MTEDKILYYAGIGSRGISQEISFLMTRVAQILSDKGYVLRSGGALGSDKAFEKGSKRSEIFYYDDATEESKVIAAKYHPVWDRLSSYVQQLHGRNVLQVLGKDLKTPCNFILCWTPDGCTTHYERSAFTGGTGTAISVAFFEKIPVFNLKRKDHLDRVLNFVRKNTPLETIR